MANTYTLSKKELRDLARVIAGTLLTQAEVCMLEETEIIEEDKHYVIDQIHKFGEAIHKKVVDKDYLELPLSVDTLTESLLAKADVSENASLISFTENIVDSWIDHPRTDNL